MESPCHLEINFLCCPRGVKNNLPPSWSPVFDMESLCDKNAAEKLRLVKEGELLFPRIFALLCFITLARLLPGDLPSWTNILYLRATMKIGYYGCFSYLYPATTFNNAQPTFKTAEILICTHVWSYCRFWDNLFKIYSTSSIPCALTHSGQPWLIIE